MPKFQKSVVVETKKTITVTITKEQLLELVKAPAYANIYTDAEYDLDSIHINWTENG